VSRSPVTLLESLRTRIRRDGPMPFEVFHDACLYDPDHGFFASGPLRSTQAGDFLTSPEVSPWFGRNIGRFVADRGSRIGGGWMLVEAGAGSGSLLRSLLTGLGDGAAPGEVVAVEVSPAARASLEAIPGVGRVVRSLAEVGPRFEGVIVANELLDNLPVALAVRRGDGWEERWVGVGGDDLILVAAPVRPDVAAWAEAFGGTLPEGAMVEVQLAATAWVHDALARLDSGALLVIDYGGTAEELEPRRTRGTLRTYRSHHLGPDPLTEPGETDITVDVNFSALLATARAAGARVRMERQDDFLTTWGLRDDLRTLRRAELELAAGPDAMARLRVRSEIKDAETLLHPRGLGDFRVLTAEVGPP
jgi:SAM-dependent MidA family methyltransferase